jgi:transcriptional regulator with XRE-family HTH domain
MAAIPTVRRRMLGLEMRKLRDGCGLSSEEVAERMGWHPTKMGRLETGRSGLKAHELSGLLDVYEVEDAVAREALSELSRQGKLRVWWSPYSDVLAQRYSSYIAFEAEAVSARNYQASLIPGLLQTPEYARAITRAIRPDSSVEKVNALVDVRLARQNATLAREEPLKLWAIVDESVVRRVVGGTAAMRKQLRHLLEASEQPHITLQVLPFKAGAHAGLLGSFVLLDFPIRGDLDVVYVEGHTSSLYLERDDDLADYGRAFDLLRASAEDVEPSRDLIAKIAEELT